MPRFLPALVATVLLATACFGDNDAPSATPTAPTPPEPTTALEPTATPWPQLRLEPVAGTLITKGGAFLLDAETGAITRIGDRSAQLSPDGTRMASRLCCLGAGFVDILDLGTGRNVRYNTGDVTYLAWSPDSQQIAFAVNAPPDQAGIYLVGRDGLGARRLTTDGHRGVLVWLAADRLGYFIGGSAGEDGVRYYTVSTTTGVVEELTATEPPTPNDPRILFGEASPSGEWLSFRTGNETWLWNKRTGATTGVGGIGAQWSPLEDKMLVFGLPNDAPYPAISIFDPDSGSGVDVPDAGLWSQWMPNGLVASVDFRCGAPLGSGGGGGSRRIVRIDPATGATSPLTPADGPFTYELAVSPVQRIAAYVSRDNSEYRLNLIDLSTGAVSVAATASDVNLDIHVHGTEAWSTDGRYVQFYVSGGHGICD